MVLRLFLLFTLVPVAELWLLLRVGRVVGPFATLAIVLGTGALGAWLAHREGARSWDRVRRELAAGRLPARELLDALLVFVAGLVLLTPGFLTDAAGFFLLIPVGRAWIRDWILWSVSRSQNVRVETRSGGTRSGGTRSGGTRSGGTRSGETRQGQARGRRRSGDVVELSPDQVVVHPPREDD